MPLWAALAVLMTLSVCANLPALGGGWVYDDWKMLGNPAMDGWDDVGAVFARNSGDYLGQGEGQFHSRGYTYRPLSMGSLILVQVASAGSPVAHHVVSLGLHVLAFGVLLLACKRPDAHRVPWWMFIVWLLFALNPCLAEAYDWINGRSDVLAGALLAVLALILIRRARLAPCATWRQGLVTASLALPVMLAGLMAKEIFVVAALALVLALSDSRAGIHESREGLTPARGWFRSRGMALAGRLPGLVPVLAALAFALAVWLVLRHSTTSASAPASLGWLFSPVAETASQLARLMALAAQTLLAPVPRPMRLLAWEFAQPWNASLVVAALIAPAGLVWLAWRRRWQAFFLVAGASACLSPTMLVGRGFWLGFDRYLYLPVLLLVLAILLPHRKTEPTSLPAPDGRVTAGQATWWLRSNLMIAFGLLVCVALLAGGRVTAGFYRSQLFFANSMLFYRPEDPSGWLLRVQEEIKAGRPALARRLLALMPASDLPPSIANALAHSQLGLGLTSAAVATVERAAARYPDHPLVRSDLLRLRAAQGRWEEVWRLAAGLRREAATCPLLLDLLRTWRASGTVPEPESGRLRDLLDTAVCGPEP